MFSKNLKEDVVNRILKHMSCHSSSSVYVATSIRQGLNFVPKKSGIFRISAKISPAPQVWRFVVNNHRYYKVYDESSSWILIQLAKDQPCKIQVDLFDSNGMALYSLETFLCAEWLSDIGQERIGYDI